MNKGFDIKNIVQDRSKLGEGIYLLYFALMVGARAIGLYEGMTVYNAILAGCMALFVCKMVVTPHSIKEYLVAGAFMLVAALVYLHTGEKGLIVCFATMLGMKGVSSKKVIRIGACVAGVIILLKIFLGVFRIVPEIYYPQERAGIGLTFRHALGYAHPNTLHMNVVMLSMMVIFLVTSWAYGRIHDGSVDGKANRRFALSVLLLASFLVLLFNIYIFLYSASRTGLLAVMAFLCVNIWFALLGRPRLFEKIVTYASYPIVCFMAIVLPLVLKGKVFDFVNRSIFTTRFSIARYFWNNNGVSLFGIRLNNPDPTMATYGIDMAQLYLFLQLGLVAFVVVSGLTMWFIHKCLVKNAMPELAVMMGMLVVGIWEPLLYNLGFKNFVYVFMGAFIYEALDTVKTRSDMKSDNSDKLVLDKSGFSELIKICAVSIFVGFAIALIAVSMTKEPRALYGDRQESESGTDFGLEAQYFEENEISELKSLGNIIIGYKDSSTPMYEYSKEIAVMEYHKGIVSAGVWGGIFVATLMSTAFTYRKKNK